MEETRPWEPARILDIPADLKDPRFTYRWASKNQVGRINKLLAEGWEIDTEIGDKLRGRIPRTIDDGSSLDSTMQVRELIIMRIPKELARKRNEYYQKLAGDTLASAEDRLRAAGNKKDMGQEGSLIYGDIKEERGG